MDDKNKKILTKKFSEFIEVVCKNNDDRWFSDYREGLLAGTVTGALDDEEE
jgi:hypothetical protein